MARRSKATEEEVELEDEGLDDAAFIEEQEEGDEDVTDIIGRTSTTRRRLDVADEDGDKPHPGHRQRRAVTITLRFGRDCPDTASRVGP